MEGGGAGRGEAAVGGGGPGCTGSPGARVSRKQRTGDPVASTGSVYLLGDGQNLFFSQGHHLAKLSVWALGTRAPGPCRGGGPYFSILV